VKKNIYQSKNVNDTNLYGQNNESILDVVYKVDRNKKYLNPDQLDKLELNMKMVGLFIDTTDISNEIFEEL
jgi:hypothetical protein